MLADKSGLRKRGEYKFPSQLDVVPMSDEAVAKMWARFVPRKQKPADIDNKPTPAVTAGE
jgi:hypothetical protein